jgi:hypothetical protein
MQIHVIYVYRRFIEYAAVLLNVRMQEVQHLDMF